VKPELNGGTLAEYLAFGYITGVETMYAGIQKLMPGHTLLVDEHGRLTTSSYWDLDVKADDGSQPRQYYVRRYREQLEECVSGHSMSDVPLGVSLSGGLDSSAIVALNTKIRREPIENFSVGYGEATYSELPYSGPSPSN
jgi:asparagine synthase (glutamine-hydrolysing)